MTNRISNDRLQMMLVQRDELLRYCACLVEMLGGRVELGPADIEVDRVLQKDTLVGVPGVVVLTTEKP